MTIQIEYFDNKKQSVITKTFNGDDSFEKAMEWGSRKIEGFTVEMMKLS